MQTRRTGRRSVRIKNRGRQKGRREKLDEIRGDQRPGEEVNDHRVKLRIP